MASDYKDYYDVFLQSRYSSDNILQRKLKDRESRDKILNFLRSNAIPTVEFGASRNMLGRSEHLVLYTNIRAHDGLGKELVTPREAVESYGNMPASCYVGNEYGVSYKRITIGGIVLWVRLQSNTDWRSNVNTSSVRIYKQEYIGDVLSHKNYIKHPLYEIDFVDSGLGLLATDFSTAPILKNYGINCYLKAVDAANEIHRSYMLLKQAGYIL